MRIRKDKDVVNRFYISLFMIVIGIVFLIPHLTAVGWGLIFGGLVLLISNIYFARKPVTDVILDERIERINDKAGHYAFWIILLILSFLSWADFYNAFEIDLKVVYQTVLLVGIYTWFVLRFYLSKRGNLE